jgi:hypothetical protein
VFPRSSQRSIDSRNSLRCSPGRIRLRTTWPDIFVDGLSGFGELDHRDRWDRLLIADSLMVGTHGTVRANLDPAGKSPRGHAAASRTVTAFKAAPRDALAGRNRLCEPVDGMRAWSGRDCPLPSNQPGIG